MRPAAPCHRWAATVGGQVAPGQHRRAAGRSRRWRGLSPKSAAAGPRCASCCVPIAALPGDRPCRAAKARALGSCSGWRPRPAGGEIESEPAEAAELSRRTGQPARRFRDFTWSTRDSWGRQRPSSPWPNGARGGPRRAVVTSPTREVHQLDTLFKSDCGNRRQERKSASRSASSISCRRTSV